VIPFAGCFVRFRVSTYLALVLCALLVPVSRARAQAFDDFTGPLGGTTSVYGQFSPSFIVVGDGAEIGSAVVDNGHSNSRVGLQLTRPAGNREFRFRFETGLGLRRSDRVTQGFTGPLLDWNKSEIRFIDASWKFDRGFRISAGHGSMATDGVVSADLSRTDQANSVSVPDMAGNFRFRTASGVLSAITVKSAFNTFDGIRRARLRYDSRPFRGVTFAVSVGAEVFDERNPERNVDVALRYEGEVRNLTLRGAAGASVTSENGLATRYDVSGSFAVLHRPSGMNLAIAAGEGQSGGLFSYYKVGILRDWFAVGPTALSVDYHFGGDIASPGSRSESWGIGIVQTLEEQGLNLYLGLRRYRLSDTSASSYQPVQAIQFGTRLKF
jgi:porin-like protein